MQTLPEPSSAPAARDGNHGPPVARAPGALTPERSRIEARVSAILALQARALGQPGFEEAALAVTTELCRALGCERVSIGLLKHQRVHIKAISNTVDFKGEREALALLSTAMEEALDQRIALVYPTPPGTMPRVTLAHRALSQANAGVSVCTVPIVDRTRVLGAMTFERRSAFDVHAARYARDAATFVGPVLELKHRADAQGVLGRMLGRSRTAAAEDAPTPVLRYVVVALALAVTAAAIWPTTYRVIAPARVEGVLERVVTAPADGFIRDVRVRPGERVRAGQLLAALEDRDLALDRDKWEAEIAQLDKQYREALSKEEAAPIVVAKAKMDQARAQLDLAVHQLERARLLAPFDGVLIRGDLTQSIGAPVKRGQELLAITPEGDFRVVAEVDEQDIADIQIDQSGRALFAAMVDAPASVSVARISPIATARDGRNFFEVEMRLVATEAEAAALLRPGLTGVAKLDIDRRSVLASWSGRATNWMRRAWWRLTT